MTPADRIERAWNRFWFAPGPAVNLAAARVLFALHALWILLSRDYAGIAAAPPGFWVGVTEPTRWRYLLFPGHAPLEAVLQACAAVALTAAVLGVLPRVACLTSALILYHLAPLETLFWTSTAYGRGLEISILALVILSASRCGDALTLGRAARRERTVPQASWEYTWPVVLVQLLVCFLYFFAGWSKLVQHGLTWADPLYIRRWLLFLNQEEQIVVFRRLGLWLAERPLACLAIGVGGYLMDLGFILVMFWKRSRIVLVPLAVAFHVAIVFSMNIVFLNVPQLLVFVDWDGLRRSRMPTADAAPALAPSSP